MKQEFNIKKESKLKPTIAPVEKPPVEKTIILKPIDIVRSIPVDIAPVSDTIPEPPVTDLPTKGLLRVSEAAEYFGVHERTIRLWIEHGHLQAEKPVGTVFISRESIKNFRLMGRRVVED